MRERLHIKTFLIMILLISLGLPAPVQAAATPAVQATAAEQPVIEASVPVQYAPALLSESAVLMDADSGQILYSKNMDEILYPASITKIMTGLLALERGELTDMITMSHDAVFTVERGSSHIALDEGEQISLQNALYALAIASANDAANGIAEHIGGTIEHFAELMNQRAKEAGALNTHFSNANGLPDPNHVTTARDMAYITRAAVNTPGWTTYFSAPRYEIPPTNLMSEVRAMYSYNSFLNGERHLDGVIACKTGYTNEAFHTLVTVVRRNGRTLIAVVMKSSLKSAKWDDTENLIEYGFSQFRPIDVQPDTFPQLTVEAQDESGQSVSAVLAVTEPVKLWLHQTVKLADLQMTLIRPNETTLAALEQSYIEVTLGGQYADRMSTEMLRLPVIPQTSGQQAISKDDRSDSLSHSSQLSKTSSWVIAILLVVLAFGLVFIAAILYAVRKREQKRRRRRERLAALRRNYQDSQIRYK